jgi:hypothetical protein
MNSNLILEKILKNNQEFYSGGNNKRVLVLYGEKKKFFIGDCCIRFDKMRHLRTFFRDSAIHINFSYKQKYEFYKALLRNNPHIDHISMLDWEDIDFMSYDIIFCFCCIEKDLLTHLQSRYGNLIGSELFRLSVFSIPVLMDKSESKRDRVFPVNTNLMAYMFMPRAGELYIGKDEEDWANQWLRSKGLLPGEDLFVLIDSTTDRSKMLDITVYFDFLKSILGRKNTRVLIFDENNIGKKEFYREWLGDQNIQKFIFSEGFGLRENLCLIASSFTRMVMGPCTGPMHCASAIYNNYVENGMAIADVPLLITYTGVYTKDNISADFWWGASPLVKCLLLKKRNGKNEMVLLSSLTMEERNADDSLPCSEYTSGLLTSFVNTQLEFSAHEFSGHTHIVPVT